MRVQMKIVCALVGLLLSFQEVFAQNQVPNSSELSKALQRVECDADTWTYFARFAAARQSGMNEKSLRHLWRGANFDALPTEVLKTLRAGNAGIPVWTDLLESENASRVSS